jgi:hypothetical protein
MKMTHIDNGTRRLTPRQEAARVELMPRFL